MAEQDLITERVLAELSKDILNATQVSGILNNPIEFPTELIDNLSLATALKYWNGQMDYHGGDCIMNNLFSFWIYNESYFNHCKFPDLAWECYNAFDAGEFYRSNDDRSIDPSEKYTRPLVKSLLREQKQIV